MAESSQASGPDHAARVQRTGRDRRGSMPWWTQPVRGRARVLGVLHRVVGATSSISAAFVHASCPNQK